jgi:hypothetical protein
VDHHAQVVPDRVARDRHGVRVPGDHEVVPDRVAPICVAGFGSGAFGAARTGAGTANTM